MLKLRFTYRTSMNFYNLVKNDGKRGAPMGDREEQRKFAQSSNIRNSEYDRQNTNLIGRTDTENFGNVLPTDIKNKKSPQSKLILIYFISMVLGIEFFIFIVPLSRYFLNETFYSGSLFLLISLIITVFFVYLIIFIGKKIWHIKY